MRFILDSLKTQLHNMKVITTLLAVVALAATSILTTSCGTAQGFGRDLQSLGRELEKAAY